MSLAAYRRHLPIEIRLPRSRLSPITDIQEREELLRALALSSMTGPVHGLEVRNAGHGCGSAVVRYEDDVAAVGWRSRHRLRVSQHHPMLLIPVWFLQLMSQAQDERRREWRVGGEMTWTPPPGWLRARRLLVMHIAEWSIPMRLCRGPQRLNMISAIRKRMK